ncbi:hypothetical protein ACS0TY_002102 [Phlomoides rotata]
MELARGPRADSRSNPAKSQFENEQLSYVVDWDSYNLSDFRIVYEHAKFYVIKSFCEDDVHKCIKYNVWSSTPSGNKKLDDAFREAEAKIIETCVECPVFLFFSVELNQGLQMLSIFMKYTAKTSVLDDFIFYENREKALRVKRNACQPKKSDYEGGEDEKGDELDLTSLSLSS